MNSLDDELVTQLRLLLDRDAIRDLVNRYCQGVWQKDIRVVDLYAEDGEFGEAVGREQLIARYEEIFGNGSNPHPYSTAPPAPQSPEHDHVQPLGVAPLVPATISML